MLVSFIFSLTFALLFCSVNANELERFCTKGPCDLTEQRSCSGWVPVDWRNRFKTVVDNTQRYIKAKLRAATSTSIETGTGPLRNEPFVVKLRHQSGQLMPMLGCCGRFNLKNTINCTVVTNRIQIFNAEKWKSSFFSCPKDTEKVSIACVNKRPTQYGSCSVETVEFLYFNPNFPESPEAAIQSVCAPDYKLCERLHCSFDVYKYGGTCRWWTMSRNINIRGNQDPKSQSMEGRLGDRQKMSVEVEVGKTKDPVVFRFASKVSSSGLNFMACCNNTSKCIAPIESPSKERGWKSQSFHCAENIEKIVVICRNKGRRRGKCSIKLLQTYKPAYNPKRPDLANKKYCTV